MKNLFIALSFLISFNSFAQKFSIWGVSNTEVLTSTSEWVDIKYLSDFNGLATCQLKVYNSDKSQVIGNFNVFSLSYAQLELMPKNTDGTTRINVTIPSLTGIASYYDGVTYWDINISSSIPDASVSSYSSSFGNVSDEIIISLQYTYNYLLSDILTIYMGSTIVYQGEYSHTVSFSVPNLAYGIYPLSLNTTSAYDVFVNFNITNTTNVFNYNEEIKNGIVHYFDFKGNLIKTASNKDAPDLTGAFIYKIIYSDNTIKQGKIYCVR